MRTKTIALAISTCLFFTAYGLAEEVKSKETKNKQTTKVKKLTANEIMKQYDNRQEPKNMISEMTMTLTGKKGKQRVRKVLTARKGKDSTIMWFLSPADVKGTSFLSEVKEGKTVMWIYLPSFNKITPITSHGSKKGGKKKSFMGSDFTYEDLEGRKHKDYTYKLLGSKKIDDKDCHIIESLPKPTLKNASYSKIVSWVWKEHTVIVKEEYYDRLGELQKVQTISKLNKVKKYWMPQVLTMKSVHRKKKTQTDIIFDDIEVDSDINEAIFSRKNLKRIFNRNRLYKKKTTKEPSKKKGK